MKGDNEGPSLRRESQYEHLYSFRNMKEKKNPLLFGDFPLTGLQKKMRLWNEQMKWNNKWKWKSITPVVLINNKLFLSNFKAYINHGYL